MVEGGGDIVPLELNFHPQCTDPASATTGDIVLNGLLWGDMLPC